MTQKLLLFDVDGVLVHPLGYKDALRDTVDHFAALMGQPPLGPSNDEIAVFEACGLTNEWDSGAMCVAALLLAALRQRPDLLRPTLGATFAAIERAGPVLPRPDFAGEARRIAQAHTDGFHPALVYLDLLAAHADPGVHPLLHALLGDVYHVTAAPVSSVFQALALGAVRFEATYGTPAPVATESYLVTRDRALLSAADRERLLAWAAEPEAGVVVFTARPSLPPADLPADAPHAQSITGYSPEGELALALLGVEGRVPLIGQGRMAWLASHNGRPPAAYVKPSPVQALAAIGTAASGHETAALLAAAALAERGELTGPLAELRRQPVRVVVFEDAVGGIRAAQHAVTRLHEAGLNITFEAIGVSPNPDKRAALQRVADHVVDDVNAGLALALGG